LAGVNLSAQLKGVSELVDTLNQLMNKTRNLQPALAQVGEYLLESHQARFQLEVAPEGTPWAPLAPQTLARKKGEDRILQERGTLRDTLAYDATATELIFGSNLEYAAAHQFGREEDGIEARPFIGITDGPWQDNVEIVEILKEHLTYW
jgi:phage virion morphogenesis protein